MERLRGVVAVVRRLWRIRVPSYEREARGSEWPLRDGSGGGFNNLIFVFFWGGFFLRPSHGCKIVVEGQRSKGVSRTGVDSEDIP